MVSKSWVINNHCKFRPVGNLWPESCHANSIEVLIYTGHPWWAKTGHLWWAKTGHLWWAKTRHPWWARVRHPRRASTGHPTGVSDTTYLEDIKPGETLVEDDAILKRDQTMNK